MPYHVESENDSCDGFAVVKDDDSKVIGCHRTQGQAERQIAALYASEMERAESQPAPKEDQVSGSSVNEEGSASGKAGGIELDDATVTALENKASDHNETMAERDRPAWTRVRVPALKAVYRRGSGAFSVSHRPGIGRAQWSMARVNAFLFLARSGRPENPNYVGDNDLLDQDHPRYSKQERQEERADSYAPTQAMIEEARRGLDWREEFNRGGTEVGVARARDIVNGRALSRDTIGRMSSFFARHEVDKQGQGFNRDEDGYPSAGRIAWALWGGDPGRAFADDIIASENRNAQGPTAVVTDIDGTLLLGREVNTALVEELNSTDADVFVVSAREEAARPQTTARLDEIGLDYDSIYLVGGANPTTAKVKQVTELLKTYNIIVAYENNETTRSAYEQIGVKAETGMLNRSIAEKILALINQTR